MIAEFQNKSITPKTALQRDLERVIKWVKANELTINKDKCQKISFARTSGILQTTYFINATLIPELSSVRDLGVILDGRWTFSE